MSTSWPCLRAVPVWPRMSGRAYAALALTGPALAMGPLIRNSDVAENIAAQLSAAQQAGQTPAQLNAGVEAASLQAISAGLGTSVLHSQHNPDDAIGIIRYHLNRLLPVQEP